MATHYKLKTNAGGFAKGTVVTEAQIKSAGADVKDWTDVGAIEETTEKAGGADTTGPVSDADNKARVERAIVDATLAKGEPLTFEELTNLAAKVTGESAKQTEAAQAEAAKPATRRASSAAASDDKGGKK